MKHYTQTPTNDTHNQIISVAAPPPLAETTPDGLQCGEKNFIALVGVESNRQEKNKCKKRSMSCVYNM